MDGERVLVTTDLSDNARPAAQSGHNLARRFRKDLELMHVFDLSRRGSREKLRIFHDEALRQRATERVQQWYRDTVEAQPDTVTLEAGDPVEKIWDRASADDVACMVMAMSGRGAWNRLIFGSTALKLSSRPPCPTAIVHPDANHIQAGMTIGVGTDFSSASDAALEEAVRWARMLNASIRIVHATTLPSTTVIHQGELPPGMAATEVVNWAHDAMDDFTRRHRERLAGLDVKSKVVTDHPVAGLRSFVEERGVDWLFLGHRNAAARGGATTVKGKWLQQMNCSTFIFPSATLPT